MIEAILVIELLVTCPSCGKEIDLLKEDNEDHTNIEDAMDFPHGDPIEIEVCCKCGANFVVKKITW